MDIDNILKEFIEKSSNELNLQSIIQFGSSTYSKDCDDIDLLFFSRHDVRTAKEILKLIEIFRYFERKYGDIVFDFSGLERKKKAKNNITVVFLGEYNLEVSHNPHDLFLFKNLSIDENKKILYGKDLFKKRNFELTNQHLFEMLSADMTYALRKSLDDENYRLMATRRLFKTIIRAMTVNYNISKKCELLPSFEKIYGERLKLPNDAERILYNDLKSGDFESVLDFAEACLKYLRKNVLSGKGKG